MLRLLSKKNTLSAPLNEEAQAFEDAARAAHALTALESSLANRIANCFDDDPFVTVILAYDTFRVTRNSFYPELAVEGWVIIDGEPFRLAATTEALESGWSTSYTLLHNGSATVWDTL